MDPTKTNSASSESHDDIDVRIEKLKQEANALANGQMRSHVSEDCPADVQEQFWRHVIAFEQGINPSPARAGSRGRPGGYSAAPSPRAVLGVADGTYVRV